MTRFRLIGDHSDLHCGCAAVTQALTAALAPFGQIVDAERDFDVLVVNGEGSMHHDRRPHLSKMNALRRAQVEGKPTYLINSLWQDNSEDFDDVLVKLTGMTVRGPASARDLADRHGLIARHSVDLSVFAPIDETAPRTDFGGQIVATDAYTPALGFVRLPQIQAAEWVDIDMADFSWSGLVRSLRTAKLLIAGRHHGMYAAVRARTPFIPIRGNSHKIEDLLEAAGSPIPIANTIQEAALLIGWAAKNRAAYDALFDWIEAQPAWTLEAALPLRQGTDGPPAPPAVDLAVSAFHRRDFPTAQAEFDKAATAFKGRTPHPRLAAMTAAGMGNGPRALEIVAEARAAKPGAFAFVKTIHQFSRDMALWQSRQPAAQWWEELRDAAFYASVGRVEKATSLAHQGVGRISDPVLASCARFLIACRMIPLRQQGLARQLLATLPVPEAPEELVLQEQLFFFAQTRDFTYESSAALLKAERSAAWSDPAFRETILSYRTLRFGTVPSEIASRRAAVAEFPKNALLRNRLISDACEACAFEALDDLPEATLKAEAPRNLVLAHHMHRAAKGSFPKHHFLFEHMEEQRAEFVKQLADPNLRIAVVGNSPVELGRGRGAKIDDHDLVIRFNDFQTSAPFDADYGSRTDVHVQTYPIYSRAAATPPPKNALLVQRNAFNIFEPRDWSPVIKAFEAGQRITWLGRKSYLEPARAIGCSPSAGLSLAHLMHVLRGPLDRASFFGFSFVDQLTGDQRAHYFNDERPSLLHDWVREAAHFETLFA